MQIRKNPLEKHIRKDFLRETALESVPTLMGLFLDILEISKLREQGQRLRTKDTEENPHESQPRSQGLSFSQKDPGNQVGQ